MTTPTQGYTFGLRSQAQLATVHPRLQAVMNRAIQLTTQDFLIVQGARSEEEAKANTASGASRTTRSLHLRQADGFAHAVDVAAFIGGKLAYEPESSFYLIALAVQKAAIELQCTIRWGGQWNCSLNSLSANLAAEHDAYNAAFYREHGRYPLQDVGHFELPRGSLAEAVSTA